MPSRLSSSDRRLLLDLARSAIVARLAAEIVPPPDPAGALAEPAGAFVTLRQRGALRGCIGYTRADQPLAEVVSRCAAASATDDPRFLPLQPSELPDIAVEISVLGAMEPISGPEEIDIGRHGLFVEKGALKGLLLPQVATEWSWDREMFLVQTCMKAGLRQDAWKTGAKIYRFEAEVFGDDTE